MGVKGDAAPMDFSPDGRRLVAWVSKANTAGQDVPSLQLWDPQQGRLLLIVQGHTDTGQNVEFHPDGRRILTGSATTPSASSEAFPWRESEYPSAGQEPLATRIRRYANGYWQDRLAAEARADQPKGQPTGSCMCPSNRSSLPRRDPGAPLICST